MRNKKRVLKSWVKSAINIIIKLFILFIINLFIINKIDIIGLFFINIYIICMNIDFKKIIELLEV